MNIALFGATGGTGKCILDSAMQEHHQIRALVRSPGKLQKKYQKLSIIQGNALNRKDVYNTINGTDGVLCVLGNTANNPTDLLTRSTRHIISGMNKHNVQRLVVLTSMGLGSTRAQIPWYARLFTNIFLNNLMGDKRQQEQLIMQSNLNWTIIRPGGLTDQIPNRNIYTGTDTGIMAGPTPRKKVAAFMLQELRKQEFLRRKPVITSKDTFDITSLSTQFRQLFQQIFTG